MDVIIEPTASKTVETPKEFQMLHDALYKKISSLLQGGSLINLKDDPTTYRILLQSAMVIVERFNNDKGKMYTGPEKKKIALTIIKWAVETLAATGFVSKATADEINQNIDFYGGVAMDIAVDAANHAFDIGQQFVADANKEGCSSACKKNYCCCFGV